jgi:hypothetical protein
MPARRDIQYTVRGIPKDLDEALRRKARQRGISLNQLLREKLAEPETTAPKKFRDLSALPGRWRHDPEFERTLASLEDW